MDLTKKDNSNTDTYNKTGYLRSDFKLFYLSDIVRKTFEFHYHDFYKVLLFLNGNVSYNIEGHYYDLKPYDTILVRAGAIHRPVINSSDPYERIIIYISKDFFDRYKTAEYDLFNCFAKADKHQSSLIRHKLQDNKLMTAVHDLARSFTGDDYAAPLYQRVKFIEYMILLNRAVNEHDIRYIPATNANQTIVNTMNYINNHLTDNISIDDIANAHYITRSYLMHLFKKETGYTIGGYITEKRLFIAKGYIQNGVSVTDACYKSGFNNYSTFYKAFCKRYDYLPKDTKNNF